ncbi:hypothetical protein ASD83_06510 [Devosia sp. Root685]|nr:hypothetical protein ASD83_06510 [Devosia sp. Root685]
MVHCTRLIALPQIVMSAPAASRRDSFPIAHRETYPRPRAKAKQIATTPAETIHAPICPTISPRAQKPLAIKGPSR